MPRNNTISIVRINQLVPMNSAPLLKVSPPSLKKMRELIKQCTSKNEIRNNPVIPINIFLPIEEDTNPDLLISRLIYCGLFKFTEMVILKTIELILKIQGKCINQNIQNQVLNKMFYSRMAIKSTITALLFRIGLNTKGLADLPLSLQF